jgi:hypothetical protein
MISRLSSSFRKSFALLPKRVQEHAKEIFKLWQLNHYHNSLAFKSVDKASKIYSIRIGLGYRALGSVSDNEIIWFWIGSHEDYNDLLSRKSY